MLKFNFDRVFAARGINFPVKFLIQHGLSINFATTIAHSRPRRIVLDSVERLCILLNCTPNELLEWTPDRKEAATADHPLYPLRKRDEAKVVKLTKMISTIPIDDLPEVEKAVEEIKQRRKG